MITVGYRLGIDFGTSNTAAAIHEPDGRSRTVLFDGFPLLPSSVCVAVEGTGLLVGREAIHAARVRPERFEPHPKRRIDDGTVLLGDLEYPVEVLIAAVLAQVRTEAVRTMNGPPATVALTYPAAWAARRRAVLSRAAGLAGIEAPELVPEPVAAASHFVTSTGADVPVSSCVVVYDFGAGTFDASVVRRTADGWEIAASDGLPDAGGLDIDAAVVGYLGAVYSAGHPDELRRLDRPETVGDRRAHRNLWEDVRTAKEILSRSSATYIHLPILEQDAPLGREQLERLARPVVERTVALTRAVLASSVPAGRLAGLFLVGGSSRMPLVATLLHQVLGVAPTVMEQPELVVAEGGARPLATGADARCGSGRPDGPSPSVAAGQAAPEPPAWIPAVLNVSRGVASVRNAAPVSEATAALAVQQLFAAIPEQSTPEEVHAAGGHPGSAPPTDPQATTPGTREAARDGHRPPDGPEPGTAPDTDRTAADTDRPDGHTPRADRPSTRRGGAGALAVAGAFLVVLVAMNLASHAAERDGSTLPAGMIEWRAWVGGREVYLYPGFLLWIAYLCSARRAGAVGRVVVYGVVLVPGTNLAYRLGEAAAVWGGTTFVFGALLTLLLLSVALLVWRRTVDGSEVRPVFGRADAGGLLLGLVLVAAVRVPEFATVVQEVRGGDTTLWQVVRIGPVPWVDRVAFGLTATLAFAGLGAAIGRFVAASAPEDEGDMRATRLWLLRIAAALVTIGGAVTVLQVSEALFTT